MGIAPDLSTPEAAVRSFCEAAEAKDVPRMGASIAEATAEKDLRRVALGEVESEELEQASRKLARAP